MFILCINDKHLSLQQSKGYFIGYKKSSIACILITHIIFINIDIYFFLSKLLLKNCVIFFLKFVSHIVFRIIILNCWLKKNVVRSDMSASL